MDKNKLAINGGEKAIKGFEGKGKPKIGKEKVGTMTHCIAAYDTESPDCLQYCRKIVDVHHRYEMPATFFIM